MDAMVPSITIDDTQVNGLLRRLQEVTGADQRAILQDQAKHACRSVVLNIPPFKASAGSPKKVGEQAIEHQLRNLVSEAVPKLVDEVTAKEGTENIRAWVTAKDRDRLELRWEHLDPPGTNLPELHQSYRDDTGRVPFVRPDKSAWTSRVVVGQGVLDPYLAVVKARVGRAKAVFALCGKKLGDTYPSFISRHFGKVTGQSVLDQSQLQNPDRPSITFGGSAPGIGRFRSNIASALRTRAKAMATRVRTLIRLKAQGKPLPPNPEPLEAVE